MLAEFLAPETIIFTSAIGLMILIGIAEAVGLGASAMGMDADFGGEAPAWLDWLGVGRVPILVVIVALLTCFGVIGLVGQQVIDALFGAALTPWIAAPVALVTALPLTGFVASGLSRILPQDETTAYPVDGLTGLIGIISVGEARVGSPARASVRDPHGQRHNVLVEPVDPDGVFKEGQEVVLVRRYGDVFKVVGNYTTLSDQWSLS